MTGLQQGGNAPVDGDSATVDFAWQAGAGVDADAASRSTSRACLRQSSGFGLRRQAGRKD